MVVDEKKLKEHLDRHIKKCACPICGKNDWTKADEVFCLRKYYEGAIIGGPSVPVIPLVCCECGYTILFNAIIIGCFEKDNG